MPGLYAFLADLLVVVHAAFVVFVLLGGWLVWRWPGVAWAHLPAALWGAAIELSGRVCPLTPIEVAWRARAGQSGYAGGFVEHYVMPALYPAGLTREIQAGLGLLVLAVNLIAYGYAVGRRGRVGPARG